MEFIQLHAKEIFALTIPFIAWILNSRFGNKAKLQLGLPHEFTFMVKEPLKAANGDIVSPTQKAVTTSYVLINSGRETATKVEIVFNWKPACLNIWPIRHYEEHDEADGRYVMIFDSLAPREAIAMELLTINADPPAIITARCDQCVSTNIQLLPHPVIKPWQRRIALALIFAGFSFTIYVSIVILQFLIANSAK